jgi:ParB family chromosome partitioning protein
MTSQPRKRLGRGLAALIGDDLSEEAVIETARGLNGLKMIAISDLAPNPRNPRQRFDEAQLQELARSIGEKGVLQPIVARPSDEPGRYEIVAGERRWRAAQKAGVHEIPVVVREMSEAEALEVALIENIQRSDLNALEEAQGYAQLMEQFDYTQQQLADTLGKSRSHIANTMRLLGLPGDVREMIVKGELSAGHARTLIATDDPSGLAKKIAKLGLSVREAEKLSKDEGKAAGKKSGVRAPETKSADVRALEKQLEEALGLSVDVTDKGRKGGRVTISYKTLEQLEDICARLMRG